MRDVQPEAGAAAERILTEVLAPIASPNALLGKQSDHMAERAT